MSKRKLAQAHVSGTCSNPVVGERVSAYVTDPLGDPSAEEVEDHLLDCRHCRDFFLVLLSLRDEARRTKNRRGENGRASSEAAIFQLSDCRKEWP